MTGKDIDDKTCQHTKLPKATIPTTHLNKHICKQRQTLKALKRRDILTWYRHTNVVGLNRFYGYPNLPLAYPVTLKILNTK